MQNKEIQKWFKKQIKEVDREFKVNKFDLFFSFMGDIIKAIILLPLLIIMVLMSPFNKKK